ncbi:Rossmann-like and DUF2520 domain-containing protein [Pectinatus frisingensis]|uniref:Rossmann-like and DUF2520 domain-containing protein n=1 Tax=Pectinatus frisingensis TaxID=865 RepID=UPI0018C77174|nr:Rossmann-like and DUF2520 domain-containing protein [Pectinatus frisingensis]
MIFINIGFIGAGKVGKSLGIYLKKHCLTVAGYYSRSFESANNAANLTQSTAYISPDELTAGCDIIFITVNDDALPDVDAQIAALLRRKTWRCKVWLHTSGAHSSECLKNIKIAGGAVGSIHPLQSFSDPQISAKFLEKTFFTIEGTAQALLVIQEILNAADADYGQITVRQKALYHTGATVISNYLVTLLDFGMQCIETAGIDKKAVFSAVAPLIEGTLDNIKRYGTVKALTGPIVRNDAGTVAAQYDSIKKYLPEKTELYRILTIATIKMAENKRITLSDAQELKCLLKKENYDE